MAYTTIPPGNSGSNPVPPVLIEASAPGADITETVSNTSNTASSRAVIQAKVAGTSADDPLFQAIVTGTTTWSFGADNSQANDPFVITRTTTLGDTSVLQIQFDNNGLTINAPTGVNTGVTFLLAGVFKSSMTWDPTSLSINAHVGKLSFQVGAVEVARAPVGAAAFKVVKGLVLADIAAAKTANYNVLVTDHTVLADATGGAFDVTLPSAVTALTGAQFTVKRLNAGGNAVTVKSTAGTIDGVAAATGIALTVQYQARTYESDGANWHIVGAHL